MPRHTLLTQRFPAPSNRQIGRFLAGDYSGALCLLATGSLVPVVVAARIDVTSRPPTSTWPGSSPRIVDMIGISMAMSLTVEGAFDAAALAVNCRKALRKMAVDPAALRRCCSPCSRPFWLGLFGPAYAAQAAPGPRTAGRRHGVPGRPTELYLGALRAQSRTSLVALIQAVRAVLMLGLTVVLTGAMGTLGAGVAVAGQPGGHRRF